VYRAGSYVLDRFLSNQREIQERFPACALVLAAGEDVEDPFKIAGT
jgi:hypothetical protein